MALGAADIARARKHLGYTAARPGVGYTFGYVTLTEPQFLFESAIQNVHPDNIADVVKLLDTLDKVECRAMEVSIRGAPAKSAEDVTPNLDEPKWLEDEAVRWATRLAELLGCPLCPWAARFAALAGGQTVGNVRVR